MIFVTQNTKMISDQKKYEKKKMNGKTKTQLSQAAIIYEP